MMSSFAPSKKKNNRMLRKRKGGGDPASRYNEEIGSKKNCTVQKCSYTLCGLAQITGTER